MGSAMAGWPAIALEHGLSAHRAKVALLARAYQWLRPAEGVSKLKVARFSGVALPLPECREAHTAHSGGSAFEPDIDVARFDTPSASIGRS
ncbi:protein of unknown function [Burkholderia multivorans]